jgi:Cu/Ag efflux protein CusF
MIRQILAITCLFAVVFSTSSCRQESPETVYRVSGTIRKIKDEGRVAVIDHEEIPGYMEAMVMPFQAKDDSVFSAAKPGDRVEFDYRVAPEGAWVENLKVIE